MSEEHQPYTADSIEVLSSREHIRKRPGMYVGDTSTSAGVEQLLWELVGNAIDEHLAGHASRVCVRLDGEWISVEDDGRGIPIDPMPEGRADAGRSVLEVVLTTLTVGWSKRPHVHVARGLHGVGLAVVNALASELHAEVRRDGRRYALSFEHGEPVGELAQLGATEERGTLIRLRPDEEIFSERTLDRVRVAAQLHTLACLNAGLVVSLDEQAWSAPAGLADYVEHLAGSRIDGAPPLHDAPIRCRGRSEGIEVEVALLWTAGAAGELRSFVNQSPTERGTHVEGLRHGLAAALSHAYEGDPPPPELARPALVELACEGLFAAVHVYLDDPRYGAPRREWLVSPEAKRAAKAIVTEQLREALARAPELRRRLLARATLSP